MKKYFVSSCAIAVLLAPSEATVAAEGAAAGRNGSPEADLNRVKAWAAVPDWSGVWRNASGYILDPSGAVPRGADGTRRGDRGTPPFTPEFEAKYKNVLAQAKKAKIMDPAVYCMPAGMPRLLTQPFAVEFIVTPERTSMIWQLDAQVRRIYTDGRGHPPADELLQTWTGDSIGHWEGDTLVVDTIGFREPSTIEGAPDQTIDRTGAQLSSDMHIVERIRMVDADTLQDDVTITDKRALTKPWRFTRLFKRAAPSEFAADYIYCSSPILSGKETDKDLLPTTREAYFEWLMNGPYADPTQKKGE
jgi:hypothetical protein